MEATAKPVPTGTTLSEQRKAEVRELWHKGKIDQLKIGQLLYDERAERLSVGGRGVYEGFHQWLREAGIPKTSAYRRIAEYEISIGERTEEFDKPSQPQQADVVQEEQGTPSDQIDSSAPNSAGRKTWDEYQIWDWLKEKHPAVYEHYLKAGMPRWIPLPKELRPDGWHAMRPTPSPEIAEQVKASCDYCAFHKSSRSCPIHGWPDTGIPSAFRQPDANAPAAPQEKPPAKRDRTLLLPSKKSVEMWKKDWNRTYKETNDGLEAELQNATTKEGKHEIRARMKETDESYEYVVERWNDFVYAMLAMSEEFTDQKPSEVLDFINNLSKVLDEEGWDFPDLND